MSTPPKTDRASCDADLEFLFRSQAPLELELARQDAEAQVQPLLHRITALEQQHADLRSQRNITYAEELSHRVQSRDSILSIRISQQQADLDEASRQIEALREQLAQEGCDHADIKKKYEELRRARPDKQESVLLIAQLELLEDQNEALRAELGKLKGHAAIRNWTDEAVERLDRLQRELHHPPNTVYQDEMAFFRAEYTTLMQQKLELDDGHWQLARLIESSHQEAERAGRLLPLAAVCAEVYLESKAARKARRVADIEQILSFDPSSIQFARRQDARSVLGPWRLLR
ncbi:hypothetical protein SLS55_007125 [Diplodia seriata]|uniref:Uncharacterized protein n=1 Tax=Diplodia seriata TaxID=420778 RepID=A0ABR3CBF1_9PEZI